MLELIPISLPKVNMDTLSIANEREIINEDGELERQCAKCEEWWPADPEFFHRNPRHPRGLHIYCKACMSEARRKSYNRKKARLVLNGAPDYRPLKKGGNQ